MTEISERASNDSLFTKVKENIKRNRQVRLEGGYNCIPWENLPGLSSVIPGIQKSRYYLVTANSKVGKTQLADYLFVYEPYEFILREMPKNIRLKIFYFSLEMSKERKILSILAYKIFKDKGLIISPEDLYSTFKKRILNAEVEALLDEYDDYFKQLEKTLVIIDNVRNPYGIFKHMEEYAKTHGKFVTKTILWTNDDKTVTEREVKDAYVPDDPDEYVIVITDHISLLSPEKGMSPHETISKYSSDYCLHMRDKWYYTIVNIQQQAAAQEKQQYTNMGESITEKLKPSADGLGDNKLVARDVDVILGLFDPARYKIKRHEGYDIERLGDHYRELLVLLNRNGSGFCSDHLLFHGAVNFFQELPAKITEEQYKSIEKTFKIR
jgi:replicative DNA helicase